MNRQRENITVPKMLTLDSTSLPILCMIYGDRGFKATSLSYIQCEETILSNHVWVRVGVKGKGHTVPHTSVDGS